MINRDGHPVKYLNRWRFTCSKLAAIALLIASGAGMAASYDATEFQTLLTQAQRSQYVRVMADLDINVPMQPEKQTPAIRSALAVKEDALIQALGGDALPAPVWRNGLGQVGVYVNAQGLQKLAANPKVRAIFRDMTTPYRLGVYDPGGRLAGLQAAIDRDGYVDVEIVYNLQSLEFDIGRQGTAVYRTTAAQRTELDQARPAFLKALPNRAVINRQQAIESAMIAASAIPTERLRVTREGLLLLQEHSSVRALRPADAPETAPSRLAQEALNFAKKYGNAIVIIELQPIAPYSPLRRKISEASWKSQAAAVRASFQEILGSVDAGLPAKTQFFDGTTAAAVSLNEAALTRLYSLNDARIAAVRLANDIATPLLMESTALVNAPGYWNVGVRGANQYVVVLDTGVESTHSFLQQAGGGSKVANEGCFSTSQTGVYMNLCPPNINGVPQNADGDIIGPGAAAPCTVSSQCDHGTHVAGIAAGRTTGQSGSLNGVAPDSGLLPMKVFSWRLTDYSLRALDVDLAAALNLVTEFNMSNLAVNMSLGGGIYNSTCDYVSTILVQHVATLANMDVPVIAGTGNSVAYGVQGSRLGISYPACLTGVIKAGAVYDTPSSYDPNGKPVAEVFYEGNLADPANFAGEFFMGPGSPIYSSVTYNGFDTKGGTSMAAPHVAGLLAAWKAAAPGYSLADVLGAARAASAPIVPIPGYSYNLRTVRMP